MLPHPILQHCASSTMDITPVVSQYIRMLLLLEQWWRTRTTVSGHATTCASLNCRPHGREGKITGQRSSKICAFLLSLETDFFIKCRHILPSVCLFSCVFTFTAAVAFCNVSVLPFIIQQGIYNCYFNILHRINMTAHAVGMDIQKTHLPISFMFTDPPKKGSGESGASSPCIA